MDRPRDRPLLTDQATRVNNIISNTTSRRTTNTINTRHLPGLLVIMRPLLDLQVNMHLLPAVLVISRPPVGLLRSSVVISSASLSN
jgi:hypothetical protein